MCGNMACNDSRLRDFLPLSANVYPKKAFTSDKR